MPTTEEKILRLATKLHLEGNLKEAASAYRNYLAKEPNNADAWSNYAVLLRKQCKHLASIGVHKRALELAPDNISILSHYANTLSDNGNYIESIEIKRRILAKDPDNVEQIRTLAAAMRGCWLNQDVIDFIDEAEGRLGSEPEFHLQRALAHLMLGNFRRGFADFESRFECTEINLPDRIPWPRWSGQKLAGKSIVVIPEQGLGDTILVSRFLPFLKAQGPRIYMVVKQPLRRLFSKLDGLDEMRDAVTIDEHFDYYIPVMSLPHWVNIRDDDLPPPPRLFIPADSRKRAQSIISPFKNRFRIGVVWTGSKNYNANHHRSVQPECFVGLAKLPGVQLFSLHKGDVEKEFTRSGMAGLIVDSCKGDRDLADTAALIDNLDLLITTDTAVVHIAAAMGKPVWNLLAHESFWAYGAGETTPWYPSMRLFRQRIQGDWEELFQRVEVELRRLLENQSP